MGLESPTYISNFVVEWPLQTDKRRQGAGHLRNIKQALVNTFLNITGEVTATHTALSAVPDNMADIFVHLMPKGSIMMWDIANNPSLPTGWVACDGSAVEGYGTVPDMRNRFVVCVGSDYLAGATGGADSKNTGDAGAHDHEGNTASHTLLLTQIPSHSHSLSEQIFVDEADVGSGVSYIVSGSGRNTGSAGGGEGHFHGISSVAAHAHTIDVRARYYAAVFIVKTTGFVPT